MTRQLFMKQLEPLGTILNEFAEGNYDNKNKIPKALANIDLRISREVIDALINNQPTAYGRNRKQGSANGQDNRIFGLYANQEGVISAYTNITDPGWTPNFAKVDETNDYNQRYEEEQKGNHRVGVFHEWEEPSYDIVFSSEDTKGLPPPHYLTSALANLLGRRDMVILTGSTENDNSDKRVRAFVPAYSRMGGIVHPNSREDFLHHNGVAPGGSTNELHKLDVEGLIKCHSTDNPLLRGGFFEINYKIE